MQANRVLGAAAALVFLGILAVGRAAAGGDEAPAGDPVPPAPPASAPAPDRDPAGAAPLAPPAVAGSPAVAPVIFAELTVTGGAERVGSVPGSAHFIGPEELRRQGYLDIHRLLRQVPGVSLQDEEGYGLRPNIGMRGTGVERSQKITLLEDGILIAPAPYAAPAAYYFPTVARMEAVEVRKGSASIQHGPYTTGGVLNLVSTSIPGGFAGRLEAAAGDRDTGRLRAAVGDAAARYGWLLETYQFATDGFKRLDGGGDTGVDLEDWMGKLRFNSPPGAVRTQALEIKAGKTEQEGDETYLGLTEADFRGDPLRRYVASAEDHLDTDHEQLQIRYFLQPARSLDLTATAYRNDFFRNWHKLESVRGVGIAEVLADPVRYGTELALLAGEIDDAAGGLKVRNNRRDYYSEGVQAVLGWNGAAAGADHRLELGWRVHRDEEDRLQNDESFNLVDGSLALFAAGAPGSQANRVSDARAFALFLQDEIRYGRLTLTPGVRYEDISFRRRDFARTDPDRGDGAIDVRENSVEVVIPGLGAAWAAGPSVTWIAGVHKGFSPPGPGEDASTDPEESLNWEAGLRWSRDGRRAEVVAFATDYDNLLGRDTLSGGGSGTGELFNGGEVTVHGLEASLAADPGARHNGRLRVPLRLTYTYTAAEFGSSFETAFADWAPRVEEGDELPYLPRHQAALSAGLAGGRWETHLDLVYLDAMRTRPGRGPIPAGEGTDEAVVGDLAGSLRLGHGLRLTAQVRNLTDEVYVAARRPAGARPGLPRTALVGFAWEF